MDNRTNRKLTTLETRELDNLFAQHKPVGDQSERHETIREAAKEFATVILRNSPESRETTVAIRRVKEAAMYAALAISVNESEDGVEINKARAERAEKHELASSRN